MCQNVSAKMNLQSEVCRQLQNTVMEFCERTYSGVNESELEVDGIICISFANSCEQHVVKIHEILRNRCLYDVGSANSSRTHKNSSHTFPNTADIAQDQSSGNIEDMVRNNSDFHTMASPMTSSTSALPCVSGQSEHTNNHKQNSKNSNSHVMQSNTCSNVANSGVESTEGGDTNTEQNDLSVSDLLSYNYAQNEGLKKKNYRESVEGGCVIIKMEPEDSEFEEDIVSDSDKQNHLHGPSRDTEFSPEMRVSEHGTTSTVHSNSDFVSKGETSEMYMVTNDFCDTQPDLCPSVNPLNSGSHQDIPLRMGTVWRNNHAPFDHGNADQLGLPGDTRYPVPVPTNKFQYLKPSTSSIQNISSPAIPTVTNSSNVIKPESTVESDCHLRIQKDTASSFSKINTIKNRKPNATSYLRNPYYSRNHRIITEAGQDITDNKSNFHVSTVNTQKGLGVHVVYPNYKGLRSFGAGHQREKFSAGPRERKYFCRTCGKGFTMKCTRTRHEKSICGSGGNNYYKCELCDKVFNRSDSRGRHMFKTHGIKGVSVL